MLSVVKCLEKFCSVYYRIYLPDKLSNKEIDSLYFMLHNFLVQAFIAISLKTFSCRSIKGN